MADDDDVQPAPDDAAEPEVDQPVDPAAGIAHSQSAVVGSEGGGTLDQIGEVVDVVDEAEGCAGGCGDLGGCGGGCGDLGGCVDGCSSCSSSLVLGLCAVVPWLWHVATWMRHRF